jgi:hypothetical protein
VLSLRLEFTFWRLLLVLREIFRISDFFNRHIVKLLGVKDFAAFQALNKFSILVSGDDSYPRVFANSRHRFVSEVVGCSFRRL